MSQEIIAEYFSKQFGSIMDAANISLSKLTEALKKVKIDAWEFHTFDGKGRRFTISFKNVVTGEVRDVTHDRDEWMKRGVVDTIREGLSDDR